jgi:hypothetical protein
LSGFFGIVETAPYSRVPDSALEAAKHNLERYFSVVGITEAFDESLCILGHEFELTVCELLHQPQRVNRTRPKWRDLSPETKGLLERHNLLDLELYDFAKKLMRKQFASLGCSWRVISRLLPFGQLLVQTAKEFAQHRRP